MNYLITRCTLWDYAGLAMIEGFINGVKTLDKEAEFACIIFRKDNRQWLPDGVIGTKKPFTTYFDQPDHMDPAFDWCDIAVDIGGLCRGSDVYRAKYQAYCAKRKKPYVFAAQSFDHPDPLIVKGYPAIARGKNSQFEYEKSTGEIPLIGADLYFLVDPIPWTKEVFDCVITTHQGKPFEKIEYKLNTNPVQIIWKPQQDDRIYEPTIINSWLSATPAQILGIVKHAKIVHTARYHMGVAAIYNNIPVEFYVDYKPKYDDLMDFSDMTQEDRRKSAMLSCELAYNEALKCK
jgi:hypothetical protein